MQLNKRVLSTKLLTEQQTELLLSAGVAVAHYNILKIELSDVVLELDKLEHVIITSSNAIHALENMPHKNVFLYVVGEKTSQQLVDYGYQVVVTARHAQELSQFIIKDYHQHHFTYLCGSHRRDDLPEALLSTQISFTEVKVYDSVVVEKSFDCIFDAVLLFSPRGVHAFAKANPKNLQLAICIGETTATAARMYTDNVKVAHKATLENTIVTAVKALLND